MMMDSSSTQKGITKQQELQDLPVKFEKMSTTDTRLLSILEIVGALQNSIKGINSTVEKVENKLSTLENNMLELWDANIGMGSPRLNEFAGPVTATKITEWFLSCEKTFANRDAQNPSSELSPEQKVRYAGDSISPGEQTSDLHRWWNDTDGITTWAEFKERFMEEALGSNWRTLVLQDFYSTRQADKTLDEYLKLLANRRWVIKHAGVGSTAMNEIDDSTYKYHMLFNADPSLIAKIMEDGAFDVIAASSDAVRSKLRKIAPTPSVPSSTSGSRSPLSNNQRPAADDKGQNALHFAAIKGDTQSVQDLMNNATLNVPDAHGHTPLFHAIAGGHTDAAFLLAQTWSVDKTLVESLIQNNTDDFKATALFANIESQNVKAVKFLLEAGASTNARGYGTWKDYKGTPLHEAAWYGPDDMVRLLLEYGGNKYAKDRYGNCPSDPSWMQFGQSMLNLP